MKIRIVKNNWAGYMPHGWGNGYVIIPIGHKLHGIDYYELNNMLGEQLSYFVHGGLTYAELLKKDDVAHFNCIAEDVGSWVVGFDTAHYGDTLDNWNEKDVLEEAENLKKYLEMLK